MAQHTLEDAQAIDWQQAVEKPGEGELHIWQWDSDEALVTPALLSCLDQLESQRYERLVTELLKQRYAASHLGMRRVLASYISVEMDELQFEIAEHGKPALLGHTLAFNLSHSGSHVLLAISQTEVGIDCEQYREVRSRDALVAKHFSSEEQTQYRSLEGDDPQRYFFQTWARKEAIVKFTGLGLAASVRKLNTQQIVSVRLPSDWQTDFETAETITLATNAPMAAAVAMQRMPTAVKVFRLHWPPA